MAPDYTGREVSVHEKDSVDRRPLWPGEVVEVKSPGEILATLDDGDALGDMPLDAGDASPRGPALHGVAAGRQDLRHGRFETEAAACTRPSSSTICAATGRLTAAARRDAGSTGTKPGFAAWDTDVGVDRSRPRSRPLSSKRVSAGREREPYGYGATDEVWLRHATEAMKASDPFADIQEPAAVLA